jgi:Flp pilus assembly protein TadD
VTRKVARRASAERRAPAAAPAGPADGREAYERGSTSLLSADVSGAIAAFHEAVRRAPADPAGYRGLGLAYAQKGDTAAAIRAFRKYLKLAPAAPDSALIARRIELLSHSSGH